MLCKKSARLLSVLLAVVLLGSLSVPAMASDYTDVSDSRWSAPYIKDLAKRGLLTGYEDGTYRPTNLITAAEALAALSRFYSLTDEARSWIYEDYGSCVEKYVDSSLSWAYDELSVCLAAGIVTENELASLNLTGAIEKQLLSVFLVRAVQLEKTALSLAGTELDFSDAKDIAAAYTGYVALLVSLGIVTVTAASSCPIRVLHVKSRQPCCRARWLMLRARRQAFNRQIRRHVEIRGHHILRRLRSPPPSSGQRPDQGIRRSFLGFRQRQRSGQNAQLHIRRQPRHRYPVRRDRIGRQNNQRRSGNMGAGQLGQRYRLVGRLLHIPYRSGYRNQNKIRPGFLHP
jgi:hypothetical protein